MAACLMLSGVGKSGSPAPKSTTSAPSRRGFSASAATLTVCSVVDEQALKGIDLHVGVGGCGFLQHRHAFGDGKKWLFLGIFQNRYDELTDQARAARDEIQMTVGRGIE